MEMLNISAELQINIIKFNLSNFGRRVRMLGSLIRERTRFNLFYHL